MEIAGEYCGKTFVPGFAERRWRSNGGWMEATGCATGAAICTCVLVQKRCGHPQVLPAYGLQDLRNERRSPKPKSNPNTMCLPGTLGEDHGSGHFYLAKTRTFLLCVDRRHRDANSAPSARFGKRPLPGKTSDCAALSGQVCLPRKNRHQGLNYPSRIRVVRRTLLFAWKSTSRLRRGMALLLVLWACASLTCGQGPTPQ